jgi:hypothetical protein
MLNKKLKEFWIKKITSVTIATCLIITSLQGLTFSMSVPVNTVPLLPQISTNIIPFNIGRVTETTYNGDGQVLVLIQDLHSHKQTQENINSILKVLDNKYGIKNIWLEGASGHLDTSWIFKIQDTTEREQVVKVLLEKGMLTGAEMFSIKSGKTDILKGIENKEVYLKNFNRLNEIYNKKVEIEEYLPQIKAILKAKTEGYFSINNRKINSLQEKNKEGKIRADKYFAYILRAMKKAGLKLSDYEQISKYVYVMAKQKRINFKRANKEIRTIITELKEVSTYQQYRELLNKVNNKETEAEFYSGIKKFAEQKGILNKYKEAEKFFEYLTYNEMLNPIELVEQEEELIDDIETSFAQNGYEKEVLFLKKYFRLIESYLMNKITADEYRYFENNRERFKLLWTKYVDIDGIINIDEYFSLFDDFYKDNVERNRCFIENITGKKPAKEKEAIVIKAGAEYNAKAIEELSKTKAGIDVVITGGFHTRGLSRLFEEEKINYIVITPNITEETVTSDNLYEKMFKEEYEIVKEKFANIPFSLLVKEIINKAEVVEEIRLSADKTSIELVTAKETIMLGHNGLINGNIAETSAKDVKLSQTQAKVAAEAFLSLQEYLKAERTNKRRIADNTEFKDTSELQKKTQKLISEIQNEKLRQAFTKKMPELSHYIVRIFDNLDIDVSDENMYGNVIVDVMKKCEKKGINVTEYWSNSVARDEIVRIINGVLKSKNLLPLLQTEGTIGRLADIQSFLEKLGFKFSEENPLSRTPFGVALGVLMEFFSLWSKDFAGQHENWSPLQQTELEKIKKQSILSGLDGTRIGAVLGLALGVAIFSNPLLSMFLGAAIVGAVSFSATEIVEHYKWNTKYPGFMLQTGGKQTFRQPGIIKELKKRGIDDKELFNFLVKFRNDKYIGLVQGCLGKKEKEPKEKIKQLLEEEYEQIFKGENFYKDYDEIEQIYDDLMYTLRATDREVYEEIRVLEKEKAIKRLTDRINRRKFDAIEQWKEALKKEKYTIVERVLIARGIIQYLNKAKTSAIPDAYIEEVFDKFIENFKSTQIEEAERFKIHEQYLKCFTEWVMSNGENPIVKEVNYDYNGTQIKGKWIRIKGKKSIEAEGKGDLEKNKQILSAISSERWCTSGRGGEITVLEKNGCDFYAFIQEGQPKSTLGFVPAEDLKKLKTDSWYYGLFEQGNGQNNIVPDMYDEAVKELQKELQSGEYQDEVGYKTLQEIGYPDIIKEKRAKKERQRKFFENIKERKVTDFTDKKSREQLQEAFSIVITQDENGNWNTVHEITDAMLDEMAETDISIVEKFLKTIKNVEESASILNANYAKYVEDLNVGGDLKLRRNSLKKGITINTGGHLDLGHVIEIEEGVSLSAGGTLALGNVTKIGENVSFSAGGLLYLNSLSFLPENVSFNTEGELVLEQVTEIGEGVSIRAGNLSLGLTKLTKETADKINKFQYNSLSLKYAKSIEDQINLRVNGNLDLRKLTEIGDRVSLSAGGNLNLVNVTKIGENVNLSTDGNLDLSAVTEIGERVSLSAGRELYLSNLNFLPKGVRITAGGNLFFINLTKIEDGSSIETGNSLFLSSVIEMGDEVSIITTGKSLILDGLTKIGDGVKLSAGGKNLNLRNVTEIGENVSLTAANTLNLEGLTTLPENTDNIKLSFEELICSNDKIKRQLIEIRDRTKRELTTEEEIDNLIHELEVAEKNYNQNKTEENKKKLEAAFINIKLDVKNMSLDTLYDIVERIFTIMQRYYNMSPEGYFEQLNMVKRFLKDKKYDIKSQTEKYMIDDNLDVDRMQSKFPNMIVSTQSIPDSYGDKDIIENLYVVFSLMLSGLGSRLNRTDFLKAVFVLDKKLLETKKIQNEFLKEKTEKELERAVKTLDFLRYSEEYESYVRQYAEESQTEGLIDDEGNILNPNQKTKSIDLKLRVQTSEGWRMKSLAQMILDSLLIKSQEIGDNFAVNILTDNQSIPAINVLLDSIIEEGAFAGKKYREVLMNKKIIQTTLGRNITGISLHRMHPSVQYDENTGIFNFYTEQYPLGHSRYAVELGEQLMSETSSNKEEEINVVTNSDNWKAGNLFNKIIGWVAKTKTPIAILVTKKGTNQGGIPMLVSETINGEEFLFYKIIESAQAEENDELKQKFNNSPNALYNTNMIVESKRAFMKQIKLAEKNINDSQNSQIRERVKRVYGLSTEEDLKAFIKTKFALADLIVNTKTNDETEEKFIQLEGAIGSALMELSNLIYVINGEHLLKFVVLNEKEKDELFGAMKNSDDFYSFLQAIEEMDVEGERSSFQQNNMSNCFVDPKSPLKKLTVKGAVKLEDLELRGDFVSVINNSKKEIIISPEILKKYDFDISDNRIILENINIVVDEKANLFVEKDGVVIMTEEERTQQADVVDVSADAVKGIVGVTKVSLLRTKQSNSQKITQIVEGANNFLYLDELQQESIEIATMFNVKPETISIVDANDTKRIREAIEIAENGTKVKIIILNSQAGEVTDETGNVIYSEDNNALLELAKKTGNLEIIKYETLEGETAAGREIIRGILENIKAKNIIGQGTKNVLYITPSLLDGREDIVYEYLQDGTILSVSTNSIKGALVKGLLNYGNLKVKTLENMIIQPANIYGTFKVEDVTDAVLKELCSKGIHTLMMDVTDADKDALNNALVRTQNAEMGIVVFGEGAENISFEGIEVEVAVKGDSQDKRRVVEYNEALTMENLSKDVIVNIAQREGANIIMTPENIKRLINAGAAIAFDGEVLREVSKENTAKNGITMLDIVKVMFTENSQQKAAKARARGIRAGRNIAVKALSAGTDLNELINNIDSILDLIQNKENGALTIIGQILGKERKLGELLDIDSTSLTGKEDDLLGKTEGILQVIELSKVVDNIKDIDRIDNMNELMAMLVEYRMLTGESYNPQKGKEVINVLSDKTHDEIMKDLSEQLKDENLSKTDKTFVLSGIIDLLLADDLRIDAQFEKMFEGMDTKGIHAMLSAA